MAETDAEAEAVADAGPLLHLDELGCLDLLADFSAVRIPETVRREVDRHRPAAVMALPASCRVVVAPRSVAARTAAVF